MSSLCSATRETPYELRRRHGVSRRGFFAVRTVQAATLGRSAGGRPRADEGFARRIEEAACTS